MDEETLQAHMAMHLQLPHSQQLEVVDPESTGVSLQAPQAMSCPRKPRSRRCPRPASATFQGMTRVPTVSRPASAPAECSGQFHPRAVSMGPHSTYHTCLHLDMHAYAGWACGIFCITLTSANCDMGAVLPVLHSCRKQKSDTQLPNKKFDGDLCTFSNENVFSRLGVGRPASLSYIRTSAGS